MVGVEASVVVAAAVSELTSCIQRAFGACLLFLPSCAACGFLSMQVRFSVDCGCFVRFEVYFYFSRSRDSGEAKIKVIDKRPFINLIAIRLIRQ